MPELPEVETVRNYLKENILNKKIINIDILYPKMIENDLNFFKDNLINNYFIDIKRKGKYLIFETNNNYLISHLRMEGKFNIKDKDDIITKHEHVIFYFNDFTLRGTLSFTIFSISYFTIFIIFSNSSFFTSKINSS